MATHRTSRLLSIAAFAAALFAAAFMVSACSQNVGVAPPNGGNGKDTGSQPAFSQFPDMPLPVKGEFDMDQTMVFGGGDSWFGRLAVLTSHSANNMFDFFKQQMPNFGWQEVTSVRSAISVLTYSRQGRVATIQIQDRTIRGSESLITVSPRGTAEPTAGSAIAPGIAPAPVQAVQ